MRSVQVTCDVLVMGIICCSSLKKPGKKRDGSFKRRHRQQATADADPAMSDDDESLTSSKCFTTLAIVKEIICLPFNVPYSKTSVLLQYSPSLLIPSTEVQIKVTLSSYTYTV